MPSEPRREPWTCRDCRYPCYLTMARSPCQGPAEPFKCPLGIASPYWERADEDREEEED